MRKHFCKAVMWILLGSTCLQTSAYAVESCYLASDSTDELILLVDRTDGTTAEVVGPFGVGLIEAMARHPVTGVTFAANANQLGTISTDTGAFTATASTFGVALAANGDLTANVTLSDVDSIAFDLSTGLLYGIQNRTGDDILFEINATTGALVPGAFGGDDYLLVSGIGSSDDIAIDFSGVMYSSGAANLYSIPFAGASGTVAAALVGPFGAGITDMEGLSTDLPGNIVGSTGASNANGAFNNSVWTIDTGDGEATNQVPISIGGDYEGFTCFLDEVDVELEKNVALTDDADGSGTITPGDEVTYTLTITNADLNKSAAGIEVTDNINSLAGITFVSFTTTKPNPGPPFPNPEYDSATGLWTVGSIPANTSYDLNIVYSIDAGVAAGTSIFNTAEITQSANPDPDSEANNDDGDQSEDDEDNAVFVVGGAPPGPVSCPAGTTLVNLATPRNADASAAGTSAGILNEAEAYGPIELLGTNLQTTGTAARLRSAEPTLVLDLTDTIPENAMIILSIARNNNPGNFDIDSSANVAGPFGGSINFAAGPNDFSQQINYFAPVGGARYLRFDRNTGSMWIDGVQYSQICESTPTADLTITKDDGSLTYTPGGTGTYTIIVTNGGPDDVVGATIADTLPDGVTLSGSWTCASSAGSSCSAASGGSAGDSAVNLTADILNTGTITVTVPVNYSSNMGDY